MKDLRQMTVDAYNISAKERAADFKALGARTKDIDEVLKQAGHLKEPHVLEIGCGDGRDAEEIMKRTPHYIGFDISEELIKLARQRVPSAQFDVADAVTYPYPKGLDVVYAFASLIHLSQEEMKEVFTKVRAALNPGGVFYMSLKFSEQYREGVEKDRYGTRQFYYYSPGDIIRLAGDDYEVLAANKSDFSTGTGVKWFNMSLRRVQS